LLLDYENETVARVRDDPNEINPGGMLGDLFDREGEAVIDYQPLPIGVLSLLESITLLDDEDDG
jgi:hypothetical protein